MIAIKYKENIMNQNPNQTGTEEKEINGSWVLLLFAVLLVGAIILGWFFT